MNDASKSPHFAIVAGETSGDFLGSDLILALRQYFPNACFTGIAGPKMIAAGCKPLFKMEELSVMGFVEVIPKLFRILSIRKQLVQHYANNPPTVFIGIDAPDFNIDLELKLKRRGIKTVHYVSPTVWAWRERRIYKIAKAIHLMLTIFPFEEAIYNKHRIPVSFVGHPLADITALKTDKHAARKALQLENKKLIIALLPGSRKSEIKYLGESFIKTAERCLQQYPSIHFVTPCVSKSIKKQFQALIKRIVPSLPITLLEGQSQTAIAASDAVLSVSGTATLETMLLKRPLVAAYKANRFSYFIAKALVKVKYIALPNLLAGKQLIPEFVQNEVSVENLSKALFQQIENKTLVAQTINEFNTIHNALKKQASNKAATAIKVLLEE